MYNAGIMPSLHILPRKRSNTLKMIICLSKHVTVIIKHVIRISNQRAMLAQSVTRMTIVLTSRGSNPGGVKIFLTHPAFFTMGSVPLSPSKAAAPMSKKEQSYTSTPLLGLHGSFQDEIYLSRSNSICTLWFII